jgi:hypothetical protein
VKAIENLQAIFSKQLSYFFSARFAPFFKEKENINTDFWSEDILGVECGRRAASCKTLTEVIKIHIIVSSLMTQCGLNRVLTFQRDILPPFSGF